MEENCTTKIWWMYGFLIFTFTFLFLLQSFLCQFLSGLFSMGCHRFSNIYWSGYMVVQFPCLKCNRAVAKNHKAVQCDICDKWVHIACNNLNTYTYKKLQKDKSPWYCICCLQKEQPYCSIDSDVLNNFKHGNRIVQSLLIQNLSLVSQNRLSTLMRKS